MTSDEKQIMESALLALTTGKINERDVKNVNYYSPIGHFNFPEPIGQAYQVVHEHDEANHLRNMSVRGVPPNSEEDAPILMDTEQIRQRATLKRKYSVPQTPSSIAVLEAVKRWKQNENQSPSSPDSPSGQACEELSFPSPSEKPADDINAEPVSPLREKSDANEDMKAWVYFPPEETWHDNEQSHRDFKAQLLQTKREKNNGLKPQEQNQIHASHPFSQWATERGLNLTRLSPQGRRQAMETYIERNTKSVADARNRLRPFLKFLDTCYPDAILPYASSRKEALRLLSLGNEELQRRADTFNHHEKCHEEFKKQFLTDPKVEKVSDLSTWQQMQIRNSYALLQWATKQDWLNLTLLSPQDRTKVMRAYNKIDPAKKSLPQFLKFLAGLYPNATQPYTPGQEEALRLALSTMELQEQASTSNNRSVESENVPELRNR